MPCYRTDRISYEWKTEPFAGALAAMFGFLCEPPLIFDDSYTSSDHPATAPSSSVDDHVAVGATPTGHPYSSSNVDDTRNQVSDQPGERHLKPAQPPSIVPPPRLNETQSSPPILPTTTRSGRVVRRPANSCDFSTVDHAHHHHHHHHVFY